MMITASAPAGLGRQGEKIEYSLMLCIMPPLLILNRLEQQESRDQQVREASGMTSGTPNSENSDIMIDDISRCPDIRVLKL